MNSDFSISNARILAIETAGREGSVALAVGSQMLYQQSFSHGLKHAAGLLPLISHLMQQAGWKPAELQGIFVSQGPGSFTGLRIGITVAKTLAMVTHARLVGVPSLQVIANNAPADAQNILVVLDAKRDQIFTALYHRNSGKLVEVEPAHLDSLASVLARIPRPIFLIGEGIPFHEKFLPRERADITIASEADWQGRAATVAQLGLALAAEGQFMTPDQLNPIYVRKPEAEEKYDLAAGLK